MINNSKKFSEFFAKSPQKRQIDFLVLHHVAADSADHAIEQFKHFGVSSHYLIDENGEIFQLVDENDVAYHAGRSFWKGEDGLNSHSIGIEFINKYPFKKKFEKTQMLAGAALCRDIIKKYQILPNNIVGHSDVAYNPANGLLDRKQDPSHLFDWNFLAQNGVGIFPKTSFSFLKNKILYKLENKGSEIKIIKEKLAKFGYKVVNFSDEFDVEMQMLTRVFNRRFIGADDDCWRVSSQMILENLLLLL